jgi:hypothetical protein
MFVTAIRAGWVQGISEADAKAEGFAGVSEYRRCWEGWSLWDQNLPVWILTFIVHQRNVMEVEASADKAVGHRKWGCSLPTVRCLDGERNVGP